MRKKCRKCGKQLNIKNDSGWELKPVKSKALGQAEYLCVKCEEVEFPKAHDSREFNKARRSWKT